MSPKHHEEPVSNRSKEEHEQVQVLQRRHPRRHRGCEHRSEIRQSSPPKKTTWKSTGSLRPQIKGPTKLIEQIKERYLPRSARSRNIHSTATPSPADDIKDRDPLRRTANAEPQQREHHYCPTEGPNGHPRNPSSTAGDRLRANPSPRPPM